MSETLAGLRKIKFAWKKAGKKAGKKHLHKPHHSLWGRRRTRFKKRSSRKKGGLPKMKFSWKKAIKQAGRKASWLTGSKRVVTGKHKKAFFHKMHCFKARHHHLKTGNKKSLKGLSTGMKDRKAAKKKGTEVEAKATSKMKVVNIKKMRREEGIAKERVSKATSREQAAKVR